MNFRAIPGLNAAIIDERTRQIVGACQVLKIEVGSLLEDKDANRKEIEQVVNQQREDASQRASEHREMNQKYIDQRRKLGK